jgi:hypothetical protein
MSMTIPDEVQKRIDKMTDVFRQELLELYHLSNGAEAEQIPTAVEIEDGIREWIRRIGQDAQSLLLGEMDRHRRKGKQDCPQCKEAVYWTRYEPRNYITSLGEMQLERAYYYHDKCHCGWVPLDKQLKIGASELSPRVQEMVSYLGAFMPFGQAQAFLSKYCGIDISHDVVNNTTVAIGQSLKEKQEAQVRHAWEESCLPVCEVTTPPKRLYVSADGINHLLPDGEGKEIKVAAVYETEERPTKEGQVEVHAVNLEYVVHTNAEELARAAYLVAVKRGVESAEEIIVLGDGANWIWNRIAGMFLKRKRTDILDFYHVTGYIWNAAKAVFGQETTTTNEWGEKQCHILKYAGPSSVLWALRTLTPAGSMIPEPVTKAITYFKNQSSRMEYPVYTQRGLQIGSGSAESAVNLVVGSRMNQAGMRWNAERAEAVAHVRAAILSDRWDSFWSEYLPPPRKYERKDLPLAS